MFQPVHRLAIELLLDCDVGHRRRWRRPCQCFSPGENQTTSPGRISSIGPPQRWARPTPDVTISVWPSGWVCHAVRAPGSNVTLAPAARAGTGASNNGSTRTVPVNHPAGPFADGCEPLRLISMTPPRVVAETRTNGINTAATTVCKTERRVYTDCRIFCVSLVMTDRLVDLLLPLAHHISSREKLTLPASFGKPVLGKQNSNTARPERLCRRAPLEPV